MVDIDQGSITISEELPELPDMERLVLQVSEKVQEHLVECRDIQDLPSLPSSPESSTPITKHSIIQALRYVCVASQMNQFVSHCHVLVGHC